MNLLKLSQKTNPKTILQELVNDKSILEKLLPIITDEQTKKRNDSVYTVIGKEVGDFRKKIKETVNKLISSLMPDIEIITSKTTFEKEKFQKYYDLERLITIFITSLFYKGYIKTLNNFENLSKPNFIETENVNDKDFSLMSLLPNTSIVEKLQNTYTYHDSNDCKKVLKIVEKHMHSSEVTRNKHLFHQSIKDTRENIDKILLSLYKKFNLFHKIEQIIPNIDEQKAIIVIENSIKELKEAPQSSIDSYWSILATQNALVEEINKFYQEEISRIWPQVSKNIFEEYLNFKDGNKLENLKTAYNRIAEFYDKKNKSWLQKIMRK